MAMKIPHIVATNALKTSAGAAWLDRLPKLFAGAKERWALTCGETIDNEEISCAWVAPVTLADGRPAVLKLGMPHFEGEHEALGLRFWGGEPTVHLLADDAELGALLLGRCQPGTPLRALPEPEQDVVISGLLRRLWRSPSAALPFRPLSALVKHWSEEALADSARWSDAGLTQEGLRLFEELPRTASTVALLATDLHAGNVLRAERQPWLVIDPKPFVGDPAFVGDPQGGYGVHDGEAGDVGEEGFFGFGVVFEGVDAAAVGCAEDQGDGEAAAGAVARVARKTRMRFGIGPSLWPMP